MNEDPLARLTQRVEILVDVVADTNRRFASLIDEVGTLSRMVRLHLIHDHGYPDEEASS